MPRKKRDEIASVVIIGSPELVRRFRKLKYRTE